MTFDVFASVTEQIVEWVSFLLFAILVYYGWLIIKGGSEGSTHREAWGLGKVGFDKLKTVGGNVKDKFSGKTKRAAKREKTKLLDEYIEEKKELELIEDAIHNAEEFDNDVKEFTQGKLNLKDLKDSFKNLKKAASEAGNETSRLSSRTFRQERQYTTLRKALEKEEIKIPDAEKQKMEVYEHDLLYQHRLVLDSMKKVAASINKMDTELQKNKAQMDAQQLSTASAVVHKELGQAYASQEQAYKECEGLTAIFSKYWK